MEHRKNSRHATNQLSAANILRGKIFAHQDSAHGRVFFMI
jgi:hypothetical protein